MHYFNPTKMVLPSFKIMQISSSSEKHMLDRPIRKCDYIRYAPQSLDKINTAI